MERESDEEIIREKIPSPPRSSSDVLDDSKPEHVKAMFSAWQSAMDNGSVPKSLRQSMSKKKMSFESQSSIASTQSEKILGSPRPSEESTNKTKRSFSMMSPWTKRSSQRLNTKDIFKNNNKRTDRAAKSRSTKIEKRVLALNINRTKTDRPDHVKAMFSAWNSVMVGSSESIKSSTSSTKSNISSTSSYVEGGGDDTPKTTESCGSMGSRASMLSDIKRASASFRVLKPSSPSPKEDHLVLEQSAREKLLDIAENAEAEKYAILLRFGLDDGKTPGVSIRDMSQSFWTYPSVFSSHEAIPWFLEHTDLTSRVRIVEIMERMNKMGLITPAGSNHHVKDKRQFWRFNTKKIART